MKKLLMMAAVAGMVFASCSNENEEYTAQGNQETEISFAAPVMYKSGTRAPGEIDGIKYPTTEKFRVFGWKYDGNYTGWVDTSLQPWEDEFSETVDGKGTEVEAKGEPVIGWFPAKRHVFTPNKKYLFAAYSPSELSTANVSYGQNGLSIKEYTVPEIGQQLDILYSNRIYDADKNSVVKNVVDNKDGSFYSGVNLKFRHAMSSVHFRACVDPDYIQAGLALGGEYAVKEGDFKIKSIKIKQAINKGTFTENVNDGENKTTYTSAPVWAVDKTSKQAEYLFLDMATSNDGNGHNVPFDNSEKDLSKSLKKIADGSYFKGGKSAILMPQIFEDDAVIEIIWTSANIGGGTEEQKTELKLKDITKNDPSTTADDGRWLPGKRYYYNIIFKENIMYFAPEVEDWETFESNIIPVL